MSVRVKICGVTSLEDALACAEAGADVLGFNFWPGSKRYLEPVEAAAIARELPSRVLKVGVFVDAERAAIERALDLVGLDAIQLHGEETAADCRGYPLAVIKAIRVGRTDGPVTELAAGFDVEYILLDADAGSGRRFDWRRAEGVAPGRLFLAGGLDPENVAEAVRRVRPYAVDTASGVESAPGKKDLRKVKEFIDNAKHA